MAAWMRKLTPLFVVLALGACKADGDDSEDTGTETGGTGDGSDDGGSGDGGGGGACVPGQSIACACPNGDTGAQVCNDDGASYGPCICEGDGGGDGGTGDDGGTGTGGDGGTGGGLPDGAPCETNDQCESGYCWSDWNEQQHEPDPAECKPECIPNADQTAYCDEDPDCCAGTCQMYGQAEGMCQGG